MASPSKRPSSSSSSPSTPHVHAHAHAHAHHSLYSLRASSSSRIHLPQPKVLPFPDLPVRGGMSRESSRIGGSPLPSPQPGGLGLGGEVDRDGTAASSSGTSSHAASSASPFRGGAPLAATRTLDSTSGGHASQLLAPPTSSPLSTRPRASTTLPPRARQEGFLPTPILRSTASVASALPHSTSLPTDSGVSVPAAAQAAGGSATPSAPDSSRAYAAAHASARPSDTAAAAPVALLTSAPSIRSLKLTTPSPATSVAITPMSSTKPLTDHLYQSFLRGTCADVRLNVRAWGVSYHVHRVVLVQAGFFHSLFLAGFSETKLAPQYHTATRDGPAEDVDLTFDDPNITRAAFEICLSRLYAPYPRLHFPGALLPTSAMPLTSSLRAVPDLQPIHLASPRDTVLATPRLLLSLLATATYLGIQPLLREALAMVLRTVGPATVVRYLDFAIGDGIGDEEWLGQQSGGVSGLQDVARPMAAGHGTPDHSDTPLEQTPRDSLAHRASTDSTADESVKCGGPVSLPPTFSASPTSPVVRTPSAASTRTVRGRAAPDLSIRTDIGLPHFYGFVSNKIGEACVCWLSRWGRDVLRVELEHRDAPPVWAAGGIPATFVSAILASDTLFVPGEMERYRMARQVLELRRQGWAESVADDPTLAETAWDDDELEIERVFAHGVFYTHMAFDDLATIAADLDSATSLPYAPLHVLQAAHWAAADIKARVTSSSCEDTATGELGLTHTSSQLAAVAAKRRAPRSRLPSPPLGMSTSTSSIRSVMSGFDANANMLGTSATPSAAVYHPVPTDDTHRIGAGGLLFLTALPSDASAIPGLPDLGPEDDVSADPAKRRPPPQSEQTFFGALSAARTAGEIEAQWKNARVVDNEVVEQRWSKHEPFRFSVEFWGVDKLAEKDRLYSQTHCYAGSYFNVYISTVRKKDKGVQLGIYLHRQTPGEPFPTPCGRSSSSISAAAPAAETELGPRPLYRTLSTSPVSIGSPDSHTIPLAPARAAPASESPPYLDTRKVTKAYFAISCASALGTALIHFSSGPDSFSLSQSWGWKSSALRSEEYLSVPAAGEDALGWTGDAGDGGSLRATVVVGVI